MLNKKNNTTDKKKTNIGKNILRVGIIVLVFAVAIVGTFIVTDRCTHNTENTGEPQFITVTVLGDKIRLEDGTTVDLEGLKTYLDTIKEKGELSTVALITDTAEPADTVLYNKVVELLSKYGIECKEMENSPASSDEATKDER